MVSTRVFTYTVAAMAAVHFTGCAAGLVRKRQDDTVTYNFFVSTSSSLGSSGALNGAYLTLVNNNYTVGVDPSADPLEVYTVASTVHKGMYELHVYPPGSTDYMLILPGTGALLPIEIVDATSKNASAAGFTAFGLGDVSLGEGPLAYSGSGGSGLSGSTGWMAFPTANGTWTVDWFSGSGILTQNIPIQIEYSQD